MFESWYVAKLKALLLVKKRRVGEYGCPFILDFPHLTLHKVPSGLNPRSPKVPEQTPVAVTFLDVSGFLVGLIIWNRPKCPICLGLAS